jgi:hypothetical protein
MADGTFFRSPRAVETRASELRFSDIGGSDPHASDGPADRYGPASDPRVVELARLIGQSDPYAPVQRRGVAARRSSCDIPEVGPAPPAVRTQRAYDAQPEPPRQAPADEESYAAGDEYAAPQAAQYDAAYGAGDYSGEDAEADAYEQGEYDYEEDPGNPGNLGNLGNDYQADRSSASKPRKTIKVVAAAAVLGLAVFGSAAALGYHTIYKAKRQGPPPVIRADNSPTKVVPAGVPGESSPKINERLGDGSQERLVRREEDPVVLRDAPRGFNANPGMQLAGVGGPAPAASAPLPAAAPPAGAGGAAGAAGAGGAADEPPPPKRVRTVSIRVDQAAPGAAVPPSRSASATRVAAAAPALPPAGAAPLALTPPAVGAAQATAALEPPQSAPARARASQSAESTGFVVQLSAQKSESEAQAAFRSLQSRYAVLNGRQPLIRRKDRGERGVVYAALVGPFGSRDEAIQLCESLKMAGGDCFVQKN